VSTGERSMDNIELLVKLEANPGIETDLISFLHLAKQSQASDPFFEIHSANVGQVMIFGEGILLKQNIKLVGVFGFSGCSNERNHAVSKA
jgi:uncharacterized protein GlcG (DUF336 family)